MIPFLFSADSVTFNSAGIGALSDAISCNVTEERNGPFELEMQYPTTGENYENISLRSIILAKPNPESDPQPFRIYDITRPMNGLVTVYAQHISYDLSGIIVEPFSVNSLTDALSGLSAHSTTANPFTASSETVSSHEFSVKTPVSFRAMLGGREGSILDVFGGEYEFDMYDIILHSHRGADNGVRIMYGKNLIDLEQEENCAETYTGVYPYWYSEEEGVVEISDVKQEKVMMISSSVSYSRIMSLDLTSMFDTKPSQDELRQAADKYITDNNIGVPRVSLTVSYQQAPGFMESVNLCDTVHVEFPDMGVSASAKVVETEYDVLADRFTSVQVGDPKSNFAETIANQFERVEDINTMVVEHNVTYRKQITDTANESATAIEAIRGGDTTISLTQLSQSIDSIAETIRDQDDQFNVVKTSAGASAEWISLNGDALSEIIGYLRAFVSGDDVVVVLGDKDSSHSKLKLVKDVLMFSNTEDSDIDLNNALAYFSDQQLFVNMANVITYLQIGTSGDGTDWQFRREDDGDLVLALI